MLQAPQFRNPVAQSAAPLGSLRDQMDRRRQQGTLYSLPEAVALVVPLCNEVGLHHARGARVFLNPSSILVDASGQTRLWPELASSPPEAARDRACLAPELLQGEFGDARASVFAIGAILYELITGDSVGPGMRRPLEVQPGLDPAIEGILGTALIIESAHRPGDLSALAQALIPFAPGLPSGADGDSRASIFPVDVSLSMLPPAEIAAAPPPSTAGAKAAVDPFGLTIVQAAAPPLTRRADDPTTKLADLKARLESDPRPRYVVIKDGMDHGPFSAVELLQQIASHAFVGEQVLRDAGSGLEKPIQDWDEFAPFAEHAKLHRDAVAEKRAIERVVVAEAKGTRTKMLVGIGVVALLLAGVGGWYVVKRGARSDAIEVAGDDGINVNVSGGLKTEKKKGGGHVGAGAFPVLTGGGMSCEQARARYVEEMTIGQAQKQADLTANQLGQVLNNGAYIVSCGTPASMHVSVCAAIQNGRAVGVTVSTDPPNGGVAGCIASKVRGMSFPSNPKLDITTTRF